MQNLYLTGGDDTADLQYYNRDPQLGDILTINEKNAYVRYNADLISVTPQATEAQQQYMQLPGKCGLIGYGKKWPVQQLDVQLYVGGAGPDEALINMSNLLAECEDCVLRHSGSRFEYAALLQSHDAQQAGVGNYHLLKMQFLAVRRLPLRSISLSGPGVVVNPGNISSGVRYTMTPSKSIDTAQICGITVKNLASGVSLCIDGIRGTVTAGGTNKFGDTDLIDFPVILPGQNLITVAPAMPVTVDFYPLFF